MSHPRWDNTQDYAFTDTLSLGQWMWEFLRRNPAYREDWAWFNNCWQTLESRYGKPPERDFARWEADPLAWRRVVDDDCGECRIDQDKVLIECWMGAKWGFYKFPLSPDTDCPVIGEQLDWRDIDWPAVTLDVADIGDYAGTPARVALGFDLELPLRRQLETAKRFLLARQKRLRRDGPLVPRTLDTQRGRWRLMLSLLDGQAAGVADDALRAWLEAHLPAGETPAELLREAAVLVDGGYRELLRLPGAT